MAEVPEVGAFFDFNQLQPNESVDQCGFAATALCFAAGPPGSDPRHPVQWAIQMMASWYTEFDGPDIRSNTNGMEDWQLYKLIVEKGGHYQAIDPHAASIASWIEARYPVIVAVAESSVFDVHSNGSPYTWNTKGLDHIFTVTGNVPAASGKHIFLCRDTVNQNAGSPYSYDGDKLVYISATVFVPDWLPRPTSAIAPHATAPSGVPQGWHDASEVLTAPNGVAVVRGFRSHVLANHWHPDNWPLAPEFGSDSLEGSNQALGKGTQQVFRWSMLGWTPKNGVFEEWTGQELLFTRGQVAKYYGLAKQLHDTAVALQADNTKLQADVQALQQALPK